MKLFDLIEKSFLALRKTNKKIWIIGIIISICSGGLMLEESLDSNAYPDFNYENEYYEGNNLEGDMEYYPEAEMFEDIFFTGTLGGIIVFILIVILAFIAIMLVVSVLIYVGTYYLYHSEYEALFDTKVNKAPLGLVVKVNLIVALKILVGLIFFIVPGIIIGVKYAPANYILCKHPELSSKEILNETKKLSKGFKWKIFIYNLFISLVFGVIMFVCSPSALVDGYILIDILDMLITFVLITFSTVYSGLFNIYLYKGMEDVENKLSIE